MLTKNVFCTFNYRSTYQTPQYISEDEFDESLQNSIMLSSFCRVNWEAYYNVTAHISGYTARRLTAMLKYNTCCNALLCEFEDIGIEDDEMKNVENEKWWVFSDENDVNAAIIGIGCNTE